MKLHQMISEGAKLSKKGIMLGNGVIAVNEPSGVDGLQMWVLKRMLGGDKELGEVGIQKDTAFPGMKPQIWFVSLRLYNGGGNDSTRIQVEGDPTQRAFDWVKSHTDVELREGIGSDAMAARRKKSAESLESHGVKLVSVNKDGTESKMNTATRHFTTKQEAINSHNYLVKINPHRRVVHNLHVTTDLGSFKLKLDGHYEGKKQ